jgi:hypothetical protein
MGRCGIPAYNTVTTHLPIYAAAGHAGRLTSGVRNRERGDQHRHAVAISNISLARRKCDSIPTRICD